jgi:hypothetical protein
MSQLSFLPNKTGILLLAYLLIHIVFHPGHWPVKEDLKLGNKLFDLLIYKLLTCVHIAHIFLQANQTNYSNKQNIFSTIYNKYPHKNPVFLTSQM